MRLFVRLSLLGLVALVAVGFLLSSNQSSPQPLVKVSVQAGQCQESGISVVVDFGISKSNQTTEKCVKNYQGNSWDLLETAGFEVLGTEKYPTAFVCRINQVPDSQTERCISTPGTANGSWAYFIADPETNSWVYSSYGAANHVAVCGSAEGWRFLASDEDLKTQPSVKPMTTSCEK
jgi:hypothetical protein